MTHSCAYFKGGARTLEERPAGQAGAGVHPLALQEGERVLDVGCGWGSFAIHAATHHRVSVLGVTPPEEQVRLTGAPAKRG